MSRKSLILSAVATLGLAIAAGVAVASNTFPATGTLQIVGGSKTLSLLQDDAGALVMSNPSSGGTLTIPDGGMPVVQYIGNAAVSTSNPMPTAEQVPTTSTITCIEAVAGTNGDGGTLSPTVGTLYELIVESGNGNVRMANTVACGSYASGTGQLENDGVDKYFRPRWYTPSVDAGAANVDAAPVYTLCSASGTVKVQLCPVQ